ncbi:MAG TPA: arabinofuranosidase catalytic domain-containing protein [Mycobacterium sp.]|nr:arabinofuranosidase catalytic domain-containing protein [Mycobacterium sp.]
MASSLVLAISSLFTWGCTITSSAQDGGGTGGSTGSGSGGSAPVTGAGGWMGTAPLPCDAFAAGGGPCVAAHSTVRALYSAYNGPLYQVRKTADGTTMDIMPLEPGGFANAADQDTFCGAGACTISIIYDQSGHNNNLTKAPAGGAKTTPDNEANAKALPVTISGHNVYGVHIVPGVGYRNNTPNGTATGDNPETEYMVVGGSFYNGGCCFDYGNMETTSRDDSEGTMEAVYFGTCTIWGRGAGSGPWVMGDLENGLWAGNVSPYNPNVPVNYKYVTGMVKGDDAGKNHWTIKVGNAQAGGFARPPTFDGQRPSSRYNPMRKEGAIGLGTGGDNSNAAQGNFFEGVMTTTYSPDDTDDAVQANIVSVYGQ